MTGAKDDGQTARPPSWATAISETEAAQRQGTQAHKSLEKALAELRSLRAWGSQVARLEIARRLTEGDDGGVLNLMLAAADGEPGDAQRACRAALDRIRTALGLASITARGEFLRVPFDLLPEFEVRGTPTADKALYRVARPGWVLDEVIVTRPVLELVDEGSRG